MRSEELDANLSSPLAHRSETFASSAPPRIRIYLMSSMLLAASIPSA